MVCTHTGTSQVGTYMHTGKGYSSYYIHVHTYFCLLVLPGIMTSALQGISNFCLKYETRTDTLVLYD